MAFDPSSATVVFDPSSAAIATPEERLKLLGDKVLSEGYPGTKIESDYKKAYIDYHSQNTTGELIGKAISDISLDKIGSAVSDSAKKLYQWHLDMNKQPDATAQSVGTMGKGALAGIQGMGSWGLDVGMAGLEGLSNLFADYMSANPKEIAADRSDAADMAIRRLKLEYAANKNLANPYDAGTPEHAQFEGGRFVGGLVVPAPAIPGATKAMEVVGNVGKNMATKAVGAALTAAPFVGETAVRAANLAKAPVRAAWGAVKDLIGTSGESLDEEGAAKTGLFNAISDTGKTMVSTPIGASVLDHVAESGPKIMDVLQDKKVQNNLKFTELKLQLDDAKFYGAPMGQLQKQLDETIQEGMAIAAQQNVTQKGLETLNWLRAKGASGISSKLANSISGALQGSATMYSLGTLTAQPGQVDNDAAAQGAIYGGFFGILGSGAFKAGGETVSPKTLREVANEKAIYTAPKTPEANVLEQYGATPGVPDRPNPVSVISGTPVDEHSLANSIKDITESATIHTADNSGHTFNLTQRKAKGSESYEFGMAPDAHLREIAQMAVPVESSFIEKLAYDPQRQISLIKMRDEAGRRGGVSTYALPGMTPEKFNAFTQGLNQAGMVEAGVKGSHGKYFNSYIKQYENHWRIKDGVWNSPAAPVAQPAPATVPEAPINKSNQP